MRGRMLSQPTITTSKKDRNFRAKDISRILFFRSFVQTQHSATNTFLFEKHETQITSLLTISFFSPTVSRTLQDNIHTNRTMATHLNRNEIMIRTIQSNVKHWTEGVIHQPEAPTNSTYFAPHFCWAVFRLACVRCNERKGIIYHITFTCHANLPFDGEKCIAPQFWWTRMKYSLVFHDVIAFLAFVRHFGMTFPCGAKGWKWMSVFGAAHTHLHSGNAWQLHTARLFLDLGSYLPGEVRTD